MSSGLVESGVYIFRLKKNICTNRSSYTAGRLRSIENNVDVWRRRVIIYGVQQKVIKAKIVKLACYPSDIDFIYANHIEINVLGQSYCFND